MRVARPPGGKRVLRRLAVEAVDEIEARAVGDAPPEGMRRHLLDLVPSHVRDLQARGACLGRAGESDDGPREHGEARRVALGAALEEHLLPDAKAEEGLAPPGLL